MVAWPVLLRMPARSARPACRGRAHARGSVTGATRTAPTSPRSARPHARPARGDRGAFSHADAPLGCGSGTHARPSRRTGARSRPPAVTARAGGRSRGRRPGSPAADRAAAAPPPSTARSSELDRRRPPVAATAGVAPRVALHDRAHRERGAEPRPPPRARRREPAPQPAAGVGGERAPERGLVDAGRLADDQRAVAVAHVGDRPSSTRRAQSRQAARRSRHSSSVRHASAGCTAQG